MSLETQPTPVNPLVKPIKIAVAIFVVLLGVFCLGYMKGKPVYEIRKEVAL